MTEPTVVRPRAILETWTDSHDQVNYKFTLPGPCRTKKAHNDAARTGRKCPVCHLGTGRVRVFPSPQFRKWQELVARYVATKPELHLFLSRPVNVRSLVFRDREIGDFDGYMNAIGDVLQHVGILLNDKYVAHRDGSRLLKDADDPRVEIVVTVLGPPEPVQEALL